MRQFRWLGGISIQYGLEQQKQQNDTIVRRLVENIYVDNVLMIDHSTQSLLHTYHVCKKIFNNMSMNLRQFITNDDACNNLIDKKDKSTASSIKILGIPWNHNTTYTSNPTKRKILQATHSTFDPLGLLTPLLLQAKLLLQDLWKQQHKWNEILPDEYNNLWKLICEQTHGFTVHVPRPIISPTESQYELHTFVDASNRAYATVTYLRAIQKNEAITNTILMARQRLALKELKLKITLINIYSDSQSWLEEKINIHLYYIPSESNPADCATKGITKEQIRQSLWWSGPDFLQQDQTTWPQLQEIHCNLKEENIETSLDDINENEHTTFTTISS
ncbi:Pao retrotransposon peptidase, partial [Ostertagia ostertagi]